MSSQKSILAQINSHDRVSGDPTNFNVNLGKDQSISNVRGVTVKSLQCVNSFYNINESNNKWYYDKGAGEFAVTVPVGQYTTTSLTANLAGLFLAQGVTLTSTDNQYTHKLSFTFSPPISVYKIRPDGSSNPIHRVVGFRSGVIQSPVASYSCEATHDLTGIKSINVLSNVLAGGRAVSSRDGGRKLALLDVIPIESPYGGIIHHSSTDFQADTTFYDSVLNNNLTDVDIVLTDENNNILNSNGLDVVITLKIYY